MQRFRSLDGMSMDPDDLISPHALDPNGSPDESSRNPSLPFLPGSIYVASQDSAEKFLQLPSEVIQRYASYLIILHLNILFKELY